MVSKHIVIDGNAFYEVDEDCMRKMGQQAERGACGPGKTAGELSDAARREQGSRGRGGGRRT